MNHRLKLLSLALSLALAAACTPPTQFPDTARPQAVAQGTQPTPKALTPQAVVKTHNHQLHFQIKLPNPGFQTQALPCSQVGFAKISLTGLGMSTPLYAEGSDTDHLVPVSSCAFEANVLDIPYGLRIASVELYDADKAPIANSTIQRAFQHDETSQTLELSYRYLPVAKVIATLLDAHDPDQTFLAQGLVTSLQTTVDDITQVTGEGAETEFGTHPVLVDTALLTQDLLAESLNADLSVYRQSGDTLTLNLSGLVGNDRLRFALDDVSSRALVTGNGTSLTITGISPAASHRLRAELVSDAGGNYTFSQSLPRSMTFTDGAATLDLTATPLLPTLVEPLPTEIYTPGRSLTLKGSHFHTNGGTTVTIEGEPATITAIGPRSLTVTIPATVTPGFDKRVYVNVGDQAASTVFDIPQRILYVNDSVSGGDEDGSSWANAYPSLQSALADAANGDYILVAEGTYTPTSGTDQTLSFNLKNGVKIFGGFDDIHPATSLADRHLGRDASVLSGDIGTLGDLPDNSYHVVYASSGLLSDTELNGFTIQAGYASGSGEDQYGGGMYLVAGRPSLTNIIFSKNAAVDGGGLYIGNSAGPSLTNIIFSQNYAFEGGGLYIGGSASSLLVNTVFIQNRRSVQGSHQPGGAAIYTCCTIGTNFVIANSTFIENDEDFTGQYPPFYGIYRNCSIFANATPTPCVLPGGESWSIFNSLFYKSDTTPVLPVVDQGSYGTDSYGNVVIHDNQGANFFRNMSDPDGSNDAFGDSDDGLNLQSGVGFYNNGLTSYYDLVPPSTDITGASRSGHITPGAYQAGP